MVAAQQNPDTIIELTDEYRDPRIAVSTAIKGRSVRPTRSTGLTLSFGTCWRPPAAGNSCHETAIHPLHPAPEQER